MNEKQKIILFVMGTLISIPFTIWFIVFFRDFLYLFTFIITSVSCIAIVAYGLYQEIYEEIIGRYSPHNWFWYDIENYVVPDKMKDKKVALVWGKDKPILNFT